MKHKKILLKIEKIEKLLIEIKEEINLLDTENASIKEVVSKTKIFWTPESLRKDFEDLYNKFIDGNSEVVDVFFENKDLKYLQEFCKANNVPLDSKKKSKDKMALEIIQWFVQRKAISKRV